MELKAKDQYYIDACDYLSADMFHSLLSFYQPVIGNIPVSLYLTMLSEGKMQKGWEEHGRLCDIMNISIMQIETALKKLEEFKLVRTFVKEDKNLKVLYLLNLPLNLEAFKQDEYLFSVFYHNLGNKHAEASLTKFNKKILKIEEYREVTSKLSEDVIERYKAEHVQFSKVKEKEVNLDKFNNGFDYDLFFTKVSALVFPIELRTDEHLELIGQVAILNGLSVDESIILVGKNIDLDHMRFDKTQFIKDATRKVPSVQMNRSNPYDVSPIVFLQEKQDGKPVSMADRHMIEKLSYTRGLTNEVINVLIEYVLEHYDNKLPANLIDKMASEWDRKKIKNVKSAKAALSNNVTPVKKRKAMPDYGEEKVEEDEAYRQKLIQQFKEANQ